MKQRIQKIISQAGIASRRKAEDLIAKGRVRVNGRIAQIGQSADLEKDIIEVNKIKISLQKKVYVILYKPRGVLSSTKDSWGRKTVVDLIKLKERVFLVGRLDLDAEGLIILTNDGELKQQVTHPRNEVQKTYEVLLDRPMTASDIKRLQKGIKIDQRRVTPNKVSVKGKKLTITIHEGRKHIVKKLINSLNYHVNNLKRTQIGRLKLGSLKPGKHRELTKKELSLLTS